MREWCQPKRFQGPSGALLEAYRIQIPEAVDVGPAEVPPGIYVVVHMEDDEYKVRTLLGPFSGEKALRLLEHATPEKLIDVFLKGVELQEAAKAAQERKDATLH